MPRAAARRRPSPPSGWSHRAPGSKVLVHTDLTLSGAVAQYGRGVGMIQATASAIMNQFANALKAQLAQQSCGAGGPDAD